MRLARAQLALACRVVGPGEVDLTVPEQPVDDRQRLLEPGDSVVEWITEGGVLRLMSPGAETEGPRGCPTVRR